MKPTPRQEELYKSRPKCFNTANLVQALTGARIPIIPPRSGIISGMDSPGDWKSSHFLEKKPIYPLKIALTHEALRVIPPVTTPPFNTCQRDASVSKRRHPCAWRAQRLIPISTREEGGCSTHVFRAYATPQQGLNTRHVIFITHSSNQVIPRRHLR